MQQITIEPADNPGNHPMPVLHWHGDYWLGRFQAMASPCDILLEGVDQTQAAQLLQRAAVETWRIERKFSRYVDGNLMDRINHSAGAAIEVDDETARLLDFADQAYRLSGGRFDITSGVLRKVWRFDGGEKLPEAQAVLALLPRIGWDRLSWRAPYLTMPTGMELDFGGIGKEYAVDRCLLLLRQHSAGWGSLSILVNFGGDLACSGPRAGGKAWRVGIEDHQAIAQASQTLQVSQGALATSGDSRRFLLHQGIRYGHVLDPRTGWPVPNSPRSVTVAAPTCTLAGMLATFAMLHGAEAERFLQEQRVMYWVQRD